MILSKTCCSLGVVLSLAVGWDVARVGAADSVQASGVLFTTVELNANETREVTLTDRSTVRLKLLSVDERRDPLRGAIREARVEIEVNGKPLVLLSGMYHLPVTFAGIQIDCPVTKGYTNNAIRGNTWGISKDARLRVWPGGSPWIDTDDFAYPLRQRWFAGDTQMGNEVTYVDGDEVPGFKQLICHYALDFSGVEGMDDVLATARGRVISAGTQAWTGLKNLAGFQESPAVPSYDSVQVLDDRGWIHGFYHLNQIDSAIRPGNRVELGQKLGVLGKEGESGGFAHLHYQIFSRQPSGLWGSHDAYAYVWEAYHRQMKPKVVAVARPHQLVSTGEKLRLDGSRSWSASGKVRRYEWTLSDGTKAPGPTVEHTYRESGEYSEILRVSDERGNVSYDFAVVQVIDQSSPALVPPTIHCAYSPTMGIKPGDPVTFKVRSFRTNASGETWDFGDGTPKVTVTSGRNISLAAKDDDAVVLAKDGYSVTQHRFAKPGDYIVSAEHRNERGRRATGHLWVRVE